MFQNDQIQGTFFSKFSLRKWQGFFCRRRDRFDLVVFTSLIYPPIVSPSNGRILSKLALFERQWMATLSVGREEMYTQPVSAERIRPIPKLDHRTGSRNSTSTSSSNYSAEIRFYSSKLPCLILWCKILSKYKPVVTSLCRSLAAITTSR